MSVKRDNITRIHGACFVLVLAMLAVGCSGDDPADPAPTPPPPPAFDAEGVYLGASTCKYHDKDDDYFGWECLVWRHEADGTLLLTHVNRLVDCGRYHEATIAVHDGVVTVTETESGPYTSCECVKDLSCSVAGVPATRFDVLVFDEDRLLLTTALDLATQPSGVHCEPRDYPMFGW